MRGPLGVAVIGLAVLGLSACTSDDGRVQAADVVAADLAGALGEGQLAGLPLAGGDQEQWDAVVGDLSDVPREVQVQDVEVVEDTATVTLAWQWDIPGAPWAYDSTAALTWAEDVWTVQWSPTVIEPTLAEGESLDLSVEQAQRGDVLGADGVPLITERGVVRFGIDKTRVPAQQAPESARALARLVGIDPADYVARVSQAGPKAFVEAVVLREAASRDVDRSALEAIPGAVGLPATLPLAPTRDFAAPILGRVGEATAEIIEESQGSVRAGDEVGLSGLEARYEEQLGGSPGVTVEAVAGDARRALLTVAPVDGQPLGTTLDPRLQRRAEAVLADVGPPSAVVVVRPSTGEILAAASGPGSQGYNTATFGQYAPGSTMKVVTALALMRAGLAPTDRVPCTTRVVVDGKPFTNYDDYPQDRTGEITLQQAVANSCNTALISQHDRLADDDLAAAAASLGLGVDHDLGFPAYFGAVPPPGSQTAKAAALIGQGEVLASPMAMAAVAASVAEGRAVVPWLLVDQPAEQGEPLSAKEANALRDMMRAVVTEGTATFLADLPGPPVGAKTGTAEFGTSVPPATHAWMIAEQGDLAVAAFVEEGDSGSGTAGPILESVLRAAG